LNISPHPDLPLVAVVAESNMEEESNGAEGRDRRIGSSFIVSRCLADWFESASSSACRVTVIRSTAVNPDEHGNYFDFEQPWLD